MENPNPAVIANEQAWVTGQDRRRLTLDDGYVKTYAYREEEVARLLAVRAAGLQNALRFTANLADGETARLNAKVVELSAKLAAAEKRLYERTQRLNRRAQIAETALAKLQAATPVVGTIEKFLEKTRKTMYALGLRYDPAIGWRNARAENAEAHLDAARESQCKCAERKCVPSGFLLPGNSPVLVAAEMASEQEIVCKRDVEWGRALEEIGIHSLSVCMPGGSITVENRLYDELRNLLVDEGVLSKDAMPNGPQIIMLVKSLSQALTECRVARDAWVNYAYVGAKAPVEHLPPIMPGETRNHTVIQRLLDTLRVTKIRLERQHYSTAEIDHVLAEFPPEL